MSILTAEALEIAFTRFSPPTAALLAPARQRLERQTQFAHLLAKGGKKAAALRDWLDQAEDCIGSLAKPLAVLRNAPIRVDGAQVEVADRIRFEDERIASDFAFGGDPILSLITLGYDQQHAFEWLQRDYGAHHIQSALAREALFALGRMVDGNLRAEMPGRRLVRISLQTEGDGGMGRIWEPAQVQSLLGLFEGSGAPVTMNEAGCFQPLHSRLGLCYMR